MGKMLMWENLTKPLDVPFNSKTFNTKSNSKEQLFNLNKKG